MTISEKFRLGLVASDVDGTLLTNRNPISAATIAAIQRCQDSGIPFIPVTGRPIRWLDPLAEQIPSLGLVVCLNGAVIYDLESAEILSSHVLDHAEVLAITSTVAESVPEVRFAFETLDGLFIESGFSTKSPRQAQIIEDHNDLADHAVAKVLISIGSSDSEALHELVSPLLADSCHVTFSNPQIGLIELAAPGITKAKTLENLCARLGVDRATVMAFGDMPNDIEMLRWAGHGVAVGNALDSVKESADAIAEAVDSDGVARYLHEILDRAK